MPLDIEELRLGFNFVKIGRLSKEIIRLLNINHQECDIIMWEDKFQYIHKHIKDFKTPDSFYNCISKIPEVIGTPDYVGIHPTKKSIEYIKRIDELLIVAIRIKSGKLALKTVFPLSEEQLRDYLNSNTVIKMNETIDK
jgi:hypothetical protein